MNCNTFKNKAPDIDPLKKLDYVSPVIERLEILRDTLGGVPAQILESLGGTYES